ncbi:glycosyltransferase family 4 protein [Henriciella marina]|uniref:Glycosyltransferase family 4 protein n=1 Tax=Henriciella marina TaxID=453851 RepID=A0ABT4LU78_9PROT|nr:glycosyltransferase family 4 protein [Henriciella marina]MCZ4297921.1 glycosyltransferase family 4 protein [Henriciella marina]
MTEARSARAIIYYAGFRHRTGGAYKHAVETAEELARTGWSVEVIAADDLPIFARYIPTILGKIINLFASPLGFYYRGRVSAFLFRLFCKRGAELTIFEEIYISWNSKTPSVTMLHATWSDNLQGLRYRERWRDRLIEKEISILNRIEHEVITVSDEYLQFLRSDIFGAKLKKRISVVPLALDVPAEAWKNPSTNARTGLVVTARLEPRKNLFFLIDVFTEFSRRNPNVTLTIIGDGPQENALKELVAQRAIPVVFTGRLNKENVFAELQKHRVYVHTSTKESFSFSLLEAKLNGLATCAFGDLQVPRLFIDYPVLDFEVENWVSNLEDALLEGPLHQVDASNYTPARMVNNTLALAGLASELNE